MTALHNFIYSQFRAKFSPIVLFVGEQRTGKTQTALRYAYDLQPRLTGDKFDFNLQFTSNATDFILQYNKCSNKILIFDETGADLDSYRSADAINRIFSHVIDSQAYKLNPVFLCLPFAVDFPKSHRKHVDAVVHIIRRGVHSIYATFSWHANLNDTKIRMLKIQTVINSPMPPKWLSDLYAKDKQVEEKEKIMDAQIQKLLKLSGKQKGVTADSDIFDISKIKRNAI